MDIALRLAGLLKMTQPMAPSLRTISLSVVVGMAMSFWGEKMQCNQYNRTVCAVRRRAGFN
jgi:hypothetical protein